MLIEHVFMHDVAQNVNGRLLNLIQILQNKESFLRIVWPVIDELRAHDKAEHFGPRNTRVPNKDFR